MATAGSIIIPQLDLYVQTNQDYPHQFNWIDDSLAGLVVVDGGDGGVLYPSNQTVVIDPPAPGGLQAAATCTVVSGLITSLTLTQAGTGYDPNNPPTVWFPPADNVQGTGALAYATVGNPVDITGSSFQMTIRDPGTDIAWIMLGSASPLTGITIVNATGGQFSILIPRAALGLLNPGVVYSYDILQLRADGTHYPLVWGYVFVTLGRTRP